MASTYSTNLKIELQATGENPGTWGTITNTNLGTALEQAIVGYGNPSYASDANLTLTYTNTNAAQTARSLVLNVTSAVSLTATRELVVPTIQKQYIVQNNTTGAQSITVKTSAGTGITVPNGRKAHLYVDGTNVIQMFDFVDINGGTIDGTTIGGASAGAGTFTTLTATTLGGALNANSQAITNVNIDSGTIDGVTLGTSSAVTEAQIDNINLNGNTISSTDTNGNLILAPNGTGDVQVNADTLRVGDSNVDATITTNGTGDLILNTNSGSSSGSIRIYDGANGDIEVTANGTGSFNVAPNMLVGTTTDFTSTGAAGAVEISGYGIYPYLPDYGSTLNTAVPTSLLVQNQEVSYSDASKLHIGAYIAPVVKNTGTGAIYNFGAQVSPVTTGTTSTGTVYTIGLNAQVTKWSPLDISTSASNRVYGLQADISHYPYPLDGTTIPLFTNNAYATYSTVRNYTGTINYMMAYAASFRIGDITTGGNTTGISAAYYWTTSAWVGATSGPTATLTNAYGVYINSPIVQATGTLTNYYAFFASAPTVTGTLTNRWGVYIADASSPNYFAGSVQVGAGTAAAPTLTTIADTNTGVFFPAADVVGVSTGGTERLRVDAAGTLGLGVTPSAWSGGFKATQYPGGSVASYASGTNLQIEVGNAYYQSSLGTYAYYNTGTAPTLYRQLSGEHRWLTAPSGTAGNAITFTQAMTLGASGNLLVGTTTDFTSTGAAGGVAVAGYGIYPWTDYFSGSAITNSTQFVGVNYESPSFTVDGSSSTTVWGVFSRLRGSVSGAGGNNGLHQGATGGKSTVLTTASTTPVSLWGGHFTASRSMSTDVSSASNAVLYGSLSFAGMDGSVGTGASSGTIRGLRASIWSGAGTTTTFQSVEAIAEATWASTDKSSTITNAHAYYGRLRFGKASGADTSSVTNAYGVGLDALDIRATATVTNYYAFYAAAPTVTGTLTNRWGVYIADASSPNYFAGSVRVGAGTDAAPTLTTIADTNTGVFFPAADVVGVSTGGTERARVKSTGQVRFVPLSADPAGAEAGDVYYNSTTNKLKVYNGSAWVDLH